MSFPRYPAYKDSGVEWLGEVPEHWEVKKLKNFASFAGGGTPSRENLDFWGGPIPWVSPKDMKAEKITQAEEGITQEGLDGSTSSLIAPGHVLLVVRSGILRHTIPVAINAVEVALNQDMKAIRINDEICSCSFLLRWIQGFNDQLLLAWGKQGATVESIEQDYLSRSLVPLPPLTEQHAITTFLDRETAKIDALIAEQQRLIELLQEKRQAVISQAVTKGLNPDAPMKDSGVEWLGEVPEHWENHRLKNLFAIKHGYAFDGSHFSDEGLYALMTPGNFNDTGGFRRKEPEKYYAGNDIPSDFILREGQMLVAMTEQAPGLVGTALFVPQGQAYLHNQRLGLVTRLKLEILDIGFLYWLMNSPLLKATIGITATGQKVRHTSPQKILEIEICLPSLAEQKDIAQALSDADERCKRLMENAHQAIRLLVERRSALISAAVTGQIDVRGLVAEGSAA